MGSSTTRLLTADPSGYGSVHGDTAGADLIEPSDEGNIALDGYREELAEIKGQVLTWREKETIEIIPQCYRYLRDVFSSVCPTLDHWLRTSRSWVRAHGRDSSFHIILSCALTVMFIASYWALLEAAVAQGTVCGVLVLANVIAGVVHVNFILDNIQKWLTVKDVWLVFMASVNEFTCIYLWCELVGRGQFHYQYPQTSDHDSVMEKFVRFTLLSTSTQSHCGLSDVVPWSWISDFVSSVQMSIGMLFNVAFLIAIGRSEHDRWCLEKRLEHLETPRSSAAVLPSLSSEKSRADGEEEQVDFSSRIWVLCASVCRCAYFNAFLVVLLLQCLDLLLIYLCDFSNPALLGSMIFQLILMVGVLSASYYLTLFARVRLSFLAQTFACSCLTFAGVYVTVSLYVPEAYEIDLQSNFTQKPEASDHYAKLIAIMVQFSLSTQTATGFAQIMPRRAFPAHILIISQILISVLYKVIIVGLGIRDLGAIATSSAKTQPNEIVVTSLVDDLNQATMQMDTLSY